MAASFAQHPSANGYDETAILRNRDKLPRGNEPALRVAPPYERFGADDCAGCQIQALAGSAIPAPAVRSRSANLSSSDCRLDRARVHLRLEELIAVAPCLFGVVHRQIGFLHQRICIRPVIGIGGDADARSDTQFMFVDVVRLTQRVEYLGRRDGCILRVSHVPEQHHEFITTMAPYGI